MLTYLAFIISTYTIAKMLIKVDETERPVVVVISIAATVIIGLLSLAILITSLQVGQSLQDLQNMFN